MTHVTRRLFVLICLLLVSGPAVALMDRGDGIHTEAWFLNNQTFYLLEEDNAEAASEGKILVQIWEQQGCGSCQKLHEVNFQDGKLVGWLKDHFAIMSNNIFGEIEVTDFDGKAKPEKEMAQRLNIHRSPTTVFYDPNGQRIFEAPGYLDPERYMALFVFVKEKGYEDAVVKGNFLRWYAANRARVSEMYQALPDQGLGS